MRDKRKVIFCFVCLIIIIISEILLYKKAYREDQEYKSNMRNFLIPISNEIEARGFIKSEDNNYNLENGYLAFERFSEGINSDYGKIELAYDISGKIKDIDICLDYSSENYSDDIFSEVYYVLNLVGIDLYEEEYIEALNILIETPSQSSEIDQEIKESKITINEKEYTFSLKRVKGESSSEKKIQFCLE